MTFEERGISDIVLGSIIFQKMLKKEEKKPQRNVMNAVRGHGKYHSQF